MTGTQRVRGKVNLVMNCLVREGVITGFQTNFGYDNMTASPCVTITVPEGRSREEVRTLMVNAIAETAIGIDVTVEHA
jgi:hypothetical protein